METYVFCVLISALIICFIILGLNEVASFRWNSVSRLFQSVKSKLPGVELACLSRLQLGLRSYVRFGVQNTESNDLISFRIIDGIFADITEFPYQVSIRFEDSHHCGGSIIAPRYILSAAHCLRGIPYEYFSVRVGSNNVDSGGHVVEVLEVYVHPNATEKFENDVAILKLRSELTFTNKIQPIKLAKPSDRLPPPGTMALVAGWGRTIENMNEMSPHLMSLEVPIISYDLCKQLYSNKRYVVDDKMFCAGNIEGGADSCLGDSGGAFVYRGIQYGIVSWGVGCGAVNKPGVYASVARFRHYIYSVARV